MDVESRDIATLGDPLMQEPKLAWYQHPFAEWYAGEFKFRHVFVSDSTGIQNSALRLLGNLPCWRMLLAVILTYLSAEGYQYTSSVCNGFTKSALFIGTSFAFIYGLYGTMADDPRGVFPPTWSNLKEEGASTFWCFMYVVFNLSQFGLITATVYVGTISTVYETGDLFDLSCLELGRSR